MKATLIDVGSIQIPDITKTYQPVGHYELIKSIKTIADDKFGDFAVDETYELAREGQQLFGSLNYKMEGDTDSNISIGFRNSYDKSLAVGLVTGQQILVCSNLCFSGDIHSYRKHTSNVMDDLEALIMQVMDASIPIYTSMNQHKDLMQADEVDDTMAAAMLGKLFINEEILNSTQLNIAKREWINGSQGKFADRNAWSLYNACTEALKTTHPTEAMNKYVDLHEFFLNHL